MKRKIIKVVLLIGILFVVLLFDINQQRKVKEQMISIVQFKDDYDKDDFIDREDVKVVVMTKKAYQTTMVLESEFVAGYLQQEVKKDTFVYQSLFSTKPMFELNSGERLITIKCSILESNGWIAKVDDLVDILMIGEESNILIEDASIFKQYDQNLLEEGLPEYYTFIVKEDDAFLFYEHYKMSDVYIVIK